jgi:membrane associated rhomboid family serine protease
MLPVVSHEVKTGRWPHATIVIIGVNLLVFLFELSVGARFVPFLQDWGLVPARVNAEVTAHNLLTVLSSVFLHVSLIHLLGNMWFLFVFGDAVEDALGTMWFLGLYLVSGFFGGMAILATSGSSPVPVVGASGAIAGVMGASLVLWPKARLRLPAVFLVPFVDLLLYELMVQAGLPVAAIVAALLASAVLLTGVAAYLAGGLFAGAIHGIRVPAVVVLAIFMGIQVFNGMLSLVNPAYGGSVGWWAHIGGFLAGVALAALAPRRRTSHAGGVANRQTATPAGKGAEAGREAALWPGPRPVRTLLGKPLGWSPRWTAAVATVAVCACSLGVARLQMGHVTAFSAREAAAVAAVQHARLTNGERYGDLLRLLTSTQAQRLLGVDGALQTPRWYAFDRPWEHRVYIVWGLGDRLTLSFVVQNGAVRADAATRLVFATVARWQTER